MNETPKEKPGPSASTLLVLLLRKLGMPRRWILTAEERAKHRTRVEGGRKAWETRKARKVLPAESPAVGSPSQPEVATPRPTAETVP